MSNKPISVKQDPCSVIKNEVFIEVELDLGTPRQECESSVLEQINIKIEAIHDTDSETVESEDCLGGNRPKIKSERKSLENDRNIEDEEDLGSNEAEVSAIDVFSCRVVKEELAESSVEVQDPLANENCEEAADTEPAFLEVTVPSLELQAKPYECNICHERFTFENNLQVHRRLHDDSRSLKCSTCQRQFSSTRTFEHHMRSHMRKRPFECHHCGKLFTQKNILENHVRVHSGEKPFTCDICHRQFKQSAHLTEHRKLHSGERPHSCHCGKQFKRRSNLLRHATTHRDETVTYPCQLCGKRMRSEAKLAKHVRAHQQPPDEVCERSIKCSTCQRHFSSVRTFELHARSHTRSRPFECHHCGKLFTQKNILENHIRVHSGEKPFSCETCHKQFKQMAHLLEHRKLHTGEMPHSCHCGRQFRKKSNLHRHATTHRSGETVMFPCLVCGKRMRTADKLAAHARCHDEPYTCECGEQLSSQAALRTHQRMHRGLPVVPEKKRKRKKKEPED